MRSGRPRPRIQITVDQLGDHVLRRVQQILVRRCPTAQRLHSLNCTRLRIPLTFTTMLPRRFLSLLLAFVALTATAAPRQVDIVIVHGTVITMAGPNIDDGAVAIN